MSVKDISRKNQTYYNDIINTNDFHPDNIKIGGKSNTKYSHLL